VTGDSPGSGDISTVIFVPDATSARLVEEPTAAAWPRWQAAKSRVAGSSVFARIES
jgi:hypothetical protein